MKTNECRRGLRKEITHLKRADFTSPFELTETASTKTTKSRCRSYH